VIGAANPTVADGGGAEGSAVSVAAHE
jgi:hypothetical protein